ncbi:hypothetical protein ABZ626_34450 [Streptomyces longispororuber]|uniref:hypothetical protein n=1 Tax=Streptomyces longispororuber TaxID=68230 RepID=UPI00340B469B
MPPAAAESVHHRSHYTHQQPFAPQASYTPQASYASPLSYTPQQSPPPPPPPQPSPPPDPPIYRALIRHWTERGRTLPGHHDPEWVRLAAPPAGSGQFTQHFGGGGEGQYGAVRDGQFGPPGDGPYAMPRGRQFGAPGEAFGGGREASFGAWHEPSPGVRRTTAFGTGRSAPQGQADDTMPIGDRGTRYDAARRPAAAPEREEERGLRPRGADPRLLITPAPQSSFGLRPEPA